MNLQRNLRLGVALLLVSGVAVMLVPYVTSYVSTSAVVNAPLLTIRAPFEGRVMASSPPVATRIRSQDVLAVLVNERQDLGEGADLRSRNLAAGRQIAALEQEVATLKALDADLAAREAAFRLQVLAANGALQKQIAASLRANRARAMEMALRVRRNRSLAAGGALPAATLEADLAQMAAIRAENGVLAAQMEDARLERDGIAAGVVPRKSGSANDYQRQRRDEIAMRLASLATDRARLLAERQALTTQTAVAAARDELHRQFNALAPTDGVVWRAAPPVGAELLAGEDVLQLLDCERRFIEVTVPERHFESIAPGSQANVRLLGSDSVFTATADAVMGSGANPGHLALAAEPKEVPPGQLRVLIRLEPPEDPGAAAAFCDVGRTAEVRFDRSLRRELRGLQRIRTSVEALIAGLWGATPARAAPE